MKVYKWNDDKKHRCPHCHAVAVDMEKVSSWAVYDCCRCGRSFARFPRLWRVLPKRGIMCSEHRGKPPATFRILALNDVGQPATLTPKDTWIPILAGLSWDRMEEQFDMLCRNSTYTFKWEREG